MPFAYIGPEKQPDQGRVGSDMKHLAENSQVVYTSFAARSYQVQAFKSTKGINQVGPVKPFHACYIGAGKSGQRHCALK
jgi:hypothetical protein